MASDLLGTLFKAMSGLSGFTRGLDNLSNNVANLNTVGYKANDVFYRELAGNQEFGATGDDGSQLFSGQGVAVGGTKLRFVDGEIAVTGNDTDMAIEGNGLFIVRDGSDEFYTRAGEFILDNDGFLIDPGTEFRVAKINDNGEISDTNLREKLVSSAAATDKVQLRGTLNSSATEGTVYPPSDATDAERIETVIYDDQGRDYTFFAEFTKEEGSAWRFRLVDSGGSFVAGNELIEFNSNGAPTPDSISQFIDLDLFDIADEDEVVQRFDGVEKISIEDTPGDLNAIGEIDIALTDGNFISRSPGNNTAPEFLTDAKVVFDADGYLTDNATQRRIGAVDPTAQDGVVDTQITLQSAAIETSAVRISGTLSATGAVGEVIPPLTVDDAGNESQENPVRVSVFDSEGVSRELTVTLVRAASEPDRVEYELVFNRGEADEFSASENLEYTPSEFTTWTLTNETITASYQPETGGSQTFDVLLNGGDGTPALTVLTTADNDLLAKQESGRSVGLVSAVEILDNGQIVVSYSNGDEEEGPTLAVVDRRVERVEIDFSAVNSAEFTESRIIVDDINGRPTGQLTSFEIQEDGTILLQYSNEEEIEDGRIALALFSNVSALQRKGDALFTVEDRDFRILGSGDDGAFGIITQRSIERSNVELSREFAEIIIVQRGFQASSQVINATNEMIEELYNSTRGGR